MPHAPEEVDRILDLFEHSNPEEFWMLVNLLNLRAEVQRSPPPQPKK